VASRSRLRASDADRESVAERLREATAEGRLLAEELEQRLASALRARTYGELDAVVADLPATHRTARPAIPLLKPAVALAIVLATVAVLAVAAIVITSLLAAWGLWMLIAWWAFGRRWGHPRRHMLRAGRAWHVPRVGGQADRRAWL
jgi:pilus assembly protein TadC